MERSTAEEQDNTTHCWAEDILADMLDKDTTAEEIGKMRDCTGYKYKAKRMRWGKIEAERRR